MVKRFRRSAAGYDEQLPSDIRSPETLRRTLDYLIIDVVGGPEPLSKVHKFVWDRTRGIRNDFSIQQVKKIPEVRIAIDCFERIARFHILSIHLLSKPGDGAEFDYFQEREQLNNTLLSLTYYYDDNRHTFRSPNEAEFRAYCILFEIQTQRPDLEDRAQDWPTDLLRDRRVQTAFKLYETAGNTKHEQGPLVPRTAFNIAQANYGGFWQVVDSRAVSYLMACVAENFFNMIRSITLEAIKKSSSRREAGWTLSELTAFLGFDEPEQVEVFCEEHGLSFAENKDGEAYLDLKSAGPIDGTCTSQQKVMLN